VTKAHPYADLFPMMSAVELDALTEDVAANGLRQPIVRYQGQVLDGRNRLLACEKAGVDPAFTDHEGDDESALALVISLNVQRRDMTSAQRAVVAARVLGQFPERRGGDPKQHARSVHVGLSRKAVGRAFKVGENSVQQAKAILAEAPDLAVQVEACAISLAFAWEQLQNRRKEAQRREKDLARISGYREAVSNGEMTWEQAMEKALQDEREEKERQSAQADARREWLKGLIGVVEYVEHYLASETDEYLTWYAEPGTPGYFDHGLTADRIRAAAAALVRTTHFGFGGDNGQKAQA
jgi:hypothetical protein